MQAIILKYSASNQKNELGQRIYDYKKGQSIEGWLDLLTGSEGDRAQALQSSSHVFMTSQVDADLKKSDRLEIAGIVYEVDFIDNPVNINHHLEIYLKVVAS